MFKKLRPCILLGLSASALSADIFGSGVNQFSMPFVEIGDPGNPAETGRTPAFGRVSYTYRMGVYEVSRAMISTYNAVSNGPKITIEDSAATWISPESPATRITWNETARFINWLNTSNGFPPAYKFTTDGAEDDITPWVTGDSGYDAANPTRNRYAHYFSPTEDEWYKAAYYDPDANEGEGGYSEFATGGEIAPLPVSGGTASGTAVFGQELSDGPASITNAGGLSAYGTMAQGGNVAELLESIFVSTNDPTIYRVQRPGSWWGFPTNPPCSRPRNGLTPSSRNTFTGFRVASVTTSSGTLLQMKNLSVEGGSVIVDLSSTVGAVDIYRSFDLINFNTTPIAENITPGLGVVIDTVSPSGQAFYKVFPHGSLAP